MEICPPQEWDAHSWYSYLAAAINCCSSEPLSIRRTAETGHDAELSPFTQWEDVTEKIEIKWGNEECARALLVMNRRASSWQDFPMNQEKITSLMIEGVHSWCSTLCVQCKQYVINGLLYCTRKNQWVLIVSYHSTTLISHPSKWLVRVCPLYFAAFLENVQYDGGCQCSASWKMSQSLLFYFIFYKKYNTNVEWTQWLHCLNIWDDLFICWLQRKMCFIVAICRMSGYITGPRLLNSSEVFQMGQIKQKKISKVPKNDMLQMFNQRNVRLQHSPTNTGSMRENNTHTIRVKTGKGGSSEKGWGNMEGVKEGLPLALKATAAHPQRGTIVPRLFLLLYFLFGEAV